MKHLLRIIESLLQRNKKILPIEEIKYLAQKCNQQICKPPLDTKEFEKQWRCALHFIKRKNNETEFVNIREYQITKEKDIQNYIGVSDVLRVKPGEYIVKGIISRISKLYNLISKVKVCCAGCGKTFDIVLDRPSSISPVNKRTNKNSKKNEM